MLSICLYRDSGNPPSVPESYFSTRILLQYQNPTSVPESYFSTRILFQILH